jgi:hypothetical protein
MSFAYVLLALNLLGIKQVPPGTQLHVRLLTTVGSYASHTGDPVAAVLIAPVVLSPAALAQDATFPASPAPDPNREAILPAGSILSGTLKAVQRVGFGFVHENAALDIVFDHITLPDGGEVPFSSRVLGVDNGRERVTKEGSIRGMRGTNTISYRFSGYVRTAMQWEFHAALAVWAIKTLLVQVPESELYYPAGVELTLTLTGPIGLHPAFAADADGPDEGLVARKLTPQALSADEREPMEELVSTLPVRTQTALTGRSSDLINLMFIGSREEITAAFVAAGWTQPVPTNMRSNIRKIRAVAEGRGDTNAPMSLLLVNDSAPDMSWQKGFNDVSKRHHIRIWKQADMPDGREIWIGAATRDIDFAYMRPGFAVTHKIEENIDRERDKVVNDLTFTSCVSVVDQFDRPTVPSFTYNATGDPMSTDTRLALVGFSPCAPGVSQGDDGSVVAPGSDATLPRHGSRVQRFARREVLCFRSDLLRENPYWRGYEGIRYLVSAIRSRHEHSADPEAYARSSYPSPQTANRASGFLDMLR